MSPPDFRRGFLRVPLSVWMTVFCRPLLTRRQFQLVSFVIRESWGWQNRTGEPQTWTRPLTSRDFSKATGLSTDHLRRDLLSLVERGVLREQAGRYQFISDVGLWKALPSRPPEPRPLPPEPPPASAFSAPWAPGLNKGKTIKDNGRLSLVEFFPPVDNSPSSLASLAPAPPTDRLADIVAAFVGSLTPVQADALRRWICEQGVAGVWQALEPAFRAGPLMARRIFLEALAEREPAEERNRSAAEQEAHE